MLTVKATGAFHDRFLIVDDKDLYHFGASLKDLGRDVPEAADGGA